MAVTGLVLGVTLQFLIVLDNAARLSVPSQQNKDNAERKKQIQSPIWMNFYKFLPNRMLWVLRLPRKDY